MTTRILLIRHAETVWNDEYRYAGATDVPLSERGREQVAKLALRLADFAIHAVYSSPSQRAMDTAQTIAAPHHLPVSPVPALRELDHGRWEGLRRTEVLERYPDELARYERDPLVNCALGGESGLMVLIRALPAFMQIVASHPNETAVVVSHKAAIRLLLAYFLGMDLRGYRDKLGQRPGALNVLDFYEDRQVKLMLLNDVSHYADNAGQDLPHVT
jgi:probable phosphoglycerate mutase